MLYGLLAVSCSMAQVSSAAAKNFVILFADDLLELIEKARFDIGDHDRIGKNARFFDPQPRRPDIKKDKPQEPREGKS